MLIFKEIFVWQTLTSNDLQKNENMIWTHMHRVNENERAHLQSGLILYSADVSPDDINTGSQVWHEVLLGYDGLNQMKTLVSIYFLYYRRIYT